MKSGQPAAPSQSRATSPNKSTTAADAARGRPPQRSSSPTRGGGNDSPSRSPTKFSESDFERKRDVVDTETRKKQAMKARGLKLEPKDWSKAELLNKLANFARFTQDKQSSIADLQFIENSTISGEELKIVDELFRRVTEIQTITLHHCNLTDDMLTKLLDNSFKQLRFVKSLSLCNNSLTYLSVETLIDAFAQRRRFRLESLNVRGNNMKFEDGQRLVMQMSYLKSLNGIRINEILQNRTPEKVESSSDEESEDDIADIVKAKKKQQQKSPLESDELMKDLEQKAFASWSTKGKATTKRAVNIVGVGAGSNPYISTPKNSLLLPNQDIKVVEVGIVVGLMQSCRGRIRHIKLDHNQINAQGFFYLLDFVRNNSEVSSLDLSYNPITNNGTNLTVVESLWKYIQSKKSLTHVNLEGVVMPQTLMESILLSVQVNRSVTYSLQNNNRFSEFLQRSMHMKAHPSRVPVKYRNPQCRYDYDPMMFMKSEVGTIGGSEGLIEAPSAAATASFVPPMSSDDYVQGLFDPPEQEFFVHNRLPVCGVDLTNKGFKLQWRRITSDDQHHSQETPVVKSNKGVHYSPNS
jgi:hypothetical protein